jgi:hypothetical protein
LVYFVLFKEGVIVLDKDELKVFRHISKGVGGFVVGLLVFVGEDQGTPLCK